MLNKVQRDNLLNFLNWVIDESDYYVHDVEDSSITPVKNRNDVIKKYGEYLKNKEKENG